MRMYEDVLYIHTYVHTCMSGEPAKSLSEGLLAETTIIGNETNPQNYNQTQNLKVNRL